MPTSKANDGAEGACDSVPEAAGTHSRHSLAGILPSSEITLTSEDKEWKEGRRKFLEHLPPDTHEYTYPGAQGLEEIVSKEYNRFINHNRSPFVVFTDVPPDEVEDREDFPGRVNYSASLQILILYMLSLPHKRCVEDFGIRLAMKAYSMGLYDDIVFRGATRTKTDDRAKQADRSWGPCSPDPNALWPTVALEVAFSEPRNRVKTDMAIWLNQSNGEVRMAISIDIERGSGIIYITSWERGTPTEQTPQPDPEEVQEIKIYPPQNFQQEHLSGDDLVIPFKQVMLRDPGNGESDFTFTEDELLGLGRKVWQAMQL